MFSSLYCYNNKLVSVSPDVSFVSASTHAQTIAELLCLKCCLGVPYLGLF